MNRPTSPIPSHSTQRNQKTPRRSRQLLAVALALSALASLWLLVTRSAAQGPVTFTTTPLVVSENERVTVESIEGETSYLKLRGNAKAVSVEYGAGTGVGELAGGTRAHALSAADFDEDGTPDLIAAYATAGGGVVTVQRGNVDAVYPNSPEARERRAKGNSTTRLS